MSFIRKILGVFKLENTSEISISEAYAEIDRANKLAEVANKTTDRAEFYNSINEIENILIELSKYENKLDFPFSPSANLQDLRRGRNEQIELLEKRISEKGKEKDNLSIPLTVHQDNQKIEESCEDKTTMEPSVVFESDIENKFSIESGNELLEDTNMCNMADEEEKHPYKSERMIVAGLHIWFISVAREILEQNVINTIPLMREYKLSENDLNQILCEMREANIIDSNNKIMMNLEEFEKFIDIYEPGLFKCKHTMFDRKSFVDIGEKIFNSGVESVYDILPANEIIDYLNIMEKLKIILYDDIKNKYDILVSREEFYDICRCVPNFSKDSNNIERTMLNMDDMDGYQFERFCADVLRKNGFEKVDVTQGSGDHGTDILAEKDDITYAIQCKCYSSDIGNAAVQQAHTGKSIYHRDIAVVLTNRYFTTQAIEEAETLGVKLWNRDKLISMVEK